MSPAHHLHVIRPSPSLFEIFAHRTVYSQQKLPLNLLFRQEQPTRLPPGFEQDILLSSLRMVPPPPPPCLLSLSILFAHAPLFFRAVAARNTAAVSVAVKGTPVNAAFPSSSRM
jgi:hypothetical protein